MANFATFLLQMEHISKNFRSIRALDDVTFAVRSGSVHALCGENGAGKSTLMKVLAGVHTPDGGKIRIDGEEKIFRTPADALRAGVAMLYQELELSDNLSVFENVFLGSEILASKLSRKVDFAAEREIVGKMINENHFRLDPDALVSELSPGQCQIVELLKALRRHARIIVMDEPTASLSESESAELFRIIRNLRDSGTGVIYISHHLQEVKEIADDISVLRDGKIVCSQAADKISIDEIVRHMVGREVGDFYPARTVSIANGGFEVENLSAPNGVKNVSFQVRRGEIVGMAGLVGAGRSETADAIFGIVPKTSGILKFDGKTLDVQSPRSAIRQGIGYLTEDRKRSGLCLMLPSSWNITLPSFRKLKMRFRLALKKERGTARQIGEKLNLKWASPDDAVETLSGGNQQKVLLGRWLLADSKFLIVDEPARGIDVGAKKEIYLLLDDLAKRGKAILFISSELPELFGVCDRILVMREGSIVGDFPTQDVTPEKIIRLAATGKIDQQENK